MILQFTHHQYGISGIFSFGGKFDMFSFGSVFLTADQIHIAIASAPARLETYTWNHTPTVRIKREAAVSRLAFQKICLACFFMFWTDPFDIFLSFYEKKMENILFPHFFLPSFPLARFFMQYVKKINVVDFKNHVFGILTNFMICYIILEVTF